MNSSLVNRIKRFSFVVFLKKISFVLIILGIFTLSLFFGVWNIKHFDYANSKFVNVSKEQMDSYLEIFKGKNIFLVSPSEIEKEVNKNNGYISSANAKKVLPNKILIYFEEYMPYYLGYSSGKCHLFSQEGIKLEEICEECEKECLEYSVSQQLIHILSNSVLESGNMLIFQQEFETISLVLSEFGYTVMDIKILNGITSITDSNDHLFIFDITYDLDTQLSRLYLVGKKINADEIEFRSLDLRFERPVMKLK